MSVMIMFPKLELKHSNNCVVMSGSVKEYECSCGAVHRARVKARNLHRRKRKFSVEIYLRNRNQIRNTTLVSADGEIFEVFTFVE